MGVMEETVTNSSAKRIINKLIWIDAKVNNEENKKNIKRRI